MNDQILTREIAPAEWSDFFDGFSRQHDGWLTTLELLDPDMGAQILAENLPLRGISVDVKDNEHVISINVGETVSEHVNHAVQNPTHVRIKLNSEGAHEAVEFETTAGLTTLLRFRVPALAETVDGVMSASG